MSRFLSAFFILSILLTRASGQVIINEVSAAASDRILQWSADGTPQLGSGIPWNAVTFNSTPWVSGNLPAGYGSTVNTNLQSAMQYKTPSLYLRKTFTITPSQAAFTTPLVLQVDADDGFIAYLNGVEVARVNCGPAKHFLYASQPAYNAATTSGIIEYTLAAANTLLVSGTNVLAIQAHNYKTDTNFRVNAGLRLITSLQNVTLTNALYDFSNANGAQRTHTNTNGTVTNVTAGTPPPGGWLATASNPTSDNTWTSLQIVSAEQQGAGLGGSGGMRYAITQSGANRGVAIHAPPVSMTGAWGAGAVNAAALAATTLKFRYQTTGDVQFALRVDPTLDLAASSVDGFPTIGVPVGGAAFSDWTTRIAGTNGAATGGFFGKIINATGVATSTLGGSINLANYDHIIGPGVRSGQVTIKEDNTAGIGPGGTTGVFAYTFNTMPAVVDSLGFAIKGISVNAWNPPNILVADFQRSRLSFRWKMPVGRQMAFYLEPSSGGTATTRATIGTLTGTGNWETYTSALSDVPTSEALRVKLNTQGTGGKVVRLTGNWAGVNFADGEQVLLDDLRLSYTPPGTEAEEDPARAFGNAAGASRTRTIDGAGVPSDATSGAPTASVTLNSDPALTGFAFRVTEDNTAGAGFNGSNGFLRCDVTDAADTVGPWGFSLPGMKVYNWTAGGITVADLADFSLQVAAKIPAGVTVQLHVEPVGGSTANRANLGTLTGNGTWQSFTRELATAGNVEAFRAALNTAVTTTFQITFVCPNDAPLGDIISIDDPVLLRWRSYQVTFGQGANQARFLDFVNQASSISFVPAFSKTTAAAPTGGTFSIDNFEVAYTGPDPSASTQLIAPSSPGGAWKYFVGIAQPSGGLYDPALLTGTFAPPLGEEGDYDNPQQFQDWVELRNLGASSVSLANWSLTDESGLPAKWKFPAGATIPANGYLIVMCDNRNEANGTATYLHTNFSLSSTGEYVALYNAAGVLQSEMAGVPDQDSFHSWGRDPAGSGGFGFIDTATPGAMNAGGFSADRVKTPDFFYADGITNFPGGFYNGAQTLRMISTTPGATIRYTTNGSDPTETNGTVYSAPLTLTPPADQKTALVYRARAFLSGRVASKLKPHTYLLDAAAALKSVPALFFNGDAGRSFFLPMGIMAINNGANPYNIPIGRGDPYERLISAEWYYPDGRDGWREDVGVRISSSPYSRPLLVLNQTALSPWISDHTQKPSFNLYWRGDYGNNEVQDTNLIPGNDVNNYARLRVRAGKNDILNPFL
ncbi:MAG: lamin tail domain-containing protein, partial [Chthoniobacteraceae bacterium]